MNNKKHTLNPTFSGTNFNEPLSKPMENTVPPIKREFLISLLRDKSKVLGNNIQEERIINFSKIDDILAKFFKNILEDSTKIKHQHKLTTLLHQYKLTIRSQ